MVNNSLLANEHARPDAQSSGSRLAFSDYKIKGVLKNE